MKSVMFASYKGGSGRTLAAANVAVTLARRGRRVGLIDLDFDAPGLHDVFEIDVGKLSFVNVIVDERPALVAKTEIRLDADRGALSAKGGTLMLLPALCSKPDLVDSVTWNSGQVD